MYDQILFLEPKSTTASSRKGKPRKKIIPPQTSKTLPLESTNKAFWKLPVNRNSAGKTIQYDKNFGDDIILPLSFIHKAIPLEDKYKFAII